jgi:hypothetical protein
MITLENNYSKKSEGGFMKNLAFVLSITLFNVSVYASQASENLVSKKKIIAVLDAINGVNDVVESVKLDTGGKLYVAYVRNGSDCQEALYRVQPIKNKPGQYTAQYVDLNWSGSCH